MIRQRPHRLRRTVAPIGAAAAATRAGAALVARINAAVVARIGAALVAAVAARAGAVALNARQSSAQGGLESRDMAVHEQLVVRRAVLAGKAGVKERLSGRDKEFVVGCQHLVFRGRGAGRVQDQFAKDNAVEVNRIFV